MVIRRIVLALALATLPAFANDLYVDVNDGSCSDSYTYVQAQVSSTPWCSISKAATAALAGDTVHIADGVYVEGSGSDNRFVPLIIPTNTGTSGNPITFQGETHGGVEVRFSTENSQTQAQAGTQTTITLHASETAAVGKSWHIRLTGGTGAGQHKQIYSYDSGTKVATLYWTGDGEGSGNRGSGWDTAPDATTTYELRQPGPTLGCDLNNEYVIYDRFKIDGEFAPYRRDTGHVIFVSTTPGNTSAGCQLINSVIVGVQSQIRDNYNAIRVENADDVVISNNTIDTIQQISTDRNASALTGYGAHNVEFSNNTVIDVDGAIFIKGYFDVRANAGWRVHHNLIYRRSLVEEDILFINVQKGDTANPNWVYQNVAYNMARCIFTNTGAGHAAEGVYIVNNTCADQYYGMRNKPFTDTEGDGPPNDLKYYNNIFYDSVTYNVWCENTAVGSTCDHQVAHGIEIEHNFYSGTPTNWGYDDGDMGTFSCATWKSEWSWDNDAPAANCDTDPVFVDEPSRDYRLCTGVDTPEVGCSGASPALTQGVDILDLDGDASTVDTVPAGAYITGDELIGVQAVEAEVSGSGSVATGGSFTGGSIQ